MTIAAVGDTFLRSRNWEKNPFFYVQEELDRADLRFLNLETVLTDETEPIAKKWVHIRTETSAAYWLRLANIHAAHIAHNHILDYGERGRRDTEQTLMECSVAPIDGRPFYFERNGLGIAIVGYFLYPDDDGREVLDELRHIRTKHDILIVSLHWGTEHARHPSPGQIELAHKIIDAGARLVLGHGPHRVQGFERYKNGLIAYSLGNFNFWQPDVETKWFNRLSGILHVTLSRNGVVDHEIVPVYIDDDYRPRVLMYPYEGKPILPCFDKLSADIANGSITWNSWYDEIGPSYVHQCLRSFGATTKRYGWAGIAKMLRWLTRRHTWRAIRAKYKCALR